MKSKIYKFFNLSFGLVLLLSLICGYLLYYVLVNNINIFFSYVIYGFSTYALIVLVIGLVKIFKGVKTRVVNNRLYKKYINDKNVRNKLSLILSFIVNLSYGIFKLLVGVFYNSWWFIVFGVYYLLLFGIRFLLFILDKKNVNDGNVFKYVGIFLIILNLVLGIIVMLSVRYDYYISYSWYLIYLVALYDFYMIINAIVQVCKNRKNKDKFVICSKYVGLASMLITMLSLEISMVNIFDQGVNNFKPVMTCLTGLGICLFNIFMAIVLIRKGERLIVKIPY